MQFGIRHFAYLLKYAIWHQKASKTRIFISLRLTPHRDDFEFMKSLSMHAEA